MEKFKTYLRERNVSEHTIRAYLGSIRQFLTMYPEPNAGNNEKYRQYLLDNYKPRTVNLRICALNSYMDYLKIPTEKLSLIHIEKDTDSDNMISMKDYEYLKQRLLEDNRKLYYFAIRLMAGAGMRSSEVVRLQVKDVKRGYLFINDSEKNRRRIYIPTKIQEECLEWLDETRRMEGPVFLNRFGEPITVTGLREQLKTYAKAYGISPALVRPKSFRRLFIKNFIERSSHIFALSQILGYEDIDETLNHLRQYPQNSRKILDDIVDW